MHNLLKITFVMLCFVFAGGTVMAGPAECHTKIERQAADALKLKYPQYRLPELADLDQQNTALDFRDGGDGCYAVAKGDFDGNGLDDIAMLLVPIEKQPVKLVVVMQQEKKWTVHDLPAFCEQIEYCYVKPEKAGTYLRTEAIDSDIDSPDERMKLTSNTTSVLSGKLESTGVVYVYTKGRWLHVWVAD